ncbi:MAG: hypothetical protein JW894_04545 [Bacteroidales bacterium]|nr:hypothetical protein [Bacteroidales bacterium]
MKYCLTFIGLLILFTGCNKSSSEDQILSDQLLSLGNDFIMEVDRVAESPDVQFPMDELDETDYTSFSGEKNYSVHFTDNGQSVTIEPGSIGGEKIVAESEILSYDLTEGLFAGGRFVVWTENGNFEAELTIYGSGIPIISSERGKLLPQ